LFIVRNIKPTIIIDYIKTITLGYKRVVRYTLYVLEQIMSMLSINAIVHVIVHISIKIINQVIISSKFKFFLHGE